MQQFAIFLCLVLMLGGYVTGMIGVFLMLGLQRLTKAKEKALKEANVRLTRSHKHIYFAAGVIYFLLVVAVLLLVCIVDPSARSWTMAGFFTAVLLVLLYASAQYIYGPNSSV